MVQLMWYKTKVVTSVVDAARELVVKLVILGRNIGRQLGHLIGYLKGKETKSIVIREPNFLKAIMFCYYNYATDKDTRKSVRGLFATLGGTLITCLSKTQRIFVLISTESEYVAISACAEEVKLVSILLEEISKVHKPLVVYEDNQRAIFLANNSQVCLCTKHIDICHYFMRDVVEGKDIDIKYIRSEENPV